MSDQDTFINGIEIITTDLATSSSGSLFTLGGISILATEDSNSLTAPSSLLILGGASVAKSINIGGTATFYNTTGNSIVVNGNMNVVGGLAVTNITLANITTNFVTAKNLLITGSTQNNITIDCQGSQVNPGTITFLGTAGTGDLRIFGDGGDIQWLGGGSRALQMGAYHEIRLKGGSTSTVLIPQFNGNTGVNNTIIENTNDSIALQVQANATQNADLTRWTNSAGSVYSSVNNLGGFNIGNTTLSTNHTTGALTVVGGIATLDDVYAKEYYTNYSGANVRLSVIGSEYNYVEVNASTTSTQITFQVRTSLTTSSLVGGTYNICVNYGMYLGSSTAANSEYRVLLDATALSTGTLLTESRFRPSRNDFVLPFSYTRTRVLTPGVHTVGIIWRNVSAGQNATIYNTSIQLYRVN